MTEGYIFREYADETENERIDGYDYETKYKRWLFMNEERREACFVELIFEDGSYTANDPDELVENLFCLAKPGLADEIESAFVNNTNGLIYLSQVPGTTPDCAIIANATPESIAEAKEICSKALKGRHYKYMFVNATNPKRWRKLGVSAAI